MLASPARRSKHKSRCTQHGSSPSYGREDEDKMGHWPQDWAARGTMQSKKSRDPQRSMSLSFRSIIEGSHYERETRYVPVDAQPAEGEKLARVIHTEGYPSGGSAEYASHSYWDGM